MHLINRGTHPGLEHRPRARPSHGWTVIELSREHRSVRHGKEPHSTDPCVSLTRPAWEMLGLGPGILGVISTMQPLV